MYSLLPTQFDYQNWVNSGSQLPFNYWMMLAGNGVSMQSQKVLANDPDLDKSLYQPPPSPARPMPMGGDPTRRVTPEEYQQMLQQQKTLQDQLYQQYIQRRKR